MGYTQHSNTESSKVIHINSEDAHKNLSTTTDTYFQFFMDNAIICPLNQRMLVSLHSAIIPYSFYNIRSGLNDIIPLIVGLAGSEVYHNITIPEGNYTSGSLKSTIQALIRTVSLDNTFTVTYNRTTMKFKYSIGADSTRDGYVAFDFSHSPNTGHIELGFRKNEVSDRIFIATPLVSTNVVDVNGSIHGLYIRTNLTQQGSFDSHTKGFNTILGKIPINENFGSVLFFHPSDSNHKVLIQTTEIHTLTIRLTDEKNRLVDLNGLNFSFSIKIDFTFAKKEKPPEIPIRYIEKRKEHKINKNPYHTKTQEEKLRHK
tara:strand:- start:5181 stop:6128 length:948 start_codon:yes stop_codon:yes gene_type:complete